MSYSSTVLADSPIAYYRLNESSGTSANDSSGNGYNGTISGTVTLSQSGALAGSTDTAMLFDGSTGKVALPLTLDASTWGGFTAELWVKLVDNTFGNYPRILSSDESQVSLTGVDLALAPSGDGNSAYFIFGNGTTAEVLGFGPGVLSTGVWYHLVFTYDGTTMKAYINGTLSASQSASGGIAGTSNPLNIASSAYSGDRTNGYFDEVALYDHVLTATQIANHYQDATVVPITGTSQLTSFDVTGSEAGTNTSTSQLTSLDATGSATASWLGTSQLTSFTADAGTETGSNTGTSQHSLTDAAAQSGINTATDTLTSFTADGSATSSISSTQPDLSFNVLGNATFLQSDASTWNPATDGQSWSVASGAATLSVNANEGQATGITGLTFIRMGSTISGDGEVLVRVAVNSTNYTAAGIFLRSTAINTGYRFRLNSNNNTFALVKTIAGTSTDLTSVSFTTSINTFYWIRAKLVGSDLYGKAWADGSQEPTAWSAQANDTGITGTGGFGVVANTTTSADIASFDLFYALIYTPGAYSIETGFVANAALTGTNSGTSQLTSFTADGSATLSISGITGISQLFSFTADSGEDEGVNTGISQHTLADAPGLQGINTAISQLSTFDNTGFATQSLIGLSLLTSFLAASGVNTGVNAGLSTLTTFDVTGSTTTFAITPPDAVSVDIATDEDVLVREGTFNIDDAIDERSTATFTVRDSTGLIRYQKGDQVVAEHNNLGVLFAGVVNTGKENLLYPNAEIHTGVQAVDDQWFTDKRTYNGPNHTNRFAGDIVTDLLPYLAEEGITASYASRRDASPTNFVEGTLTNVEATEDGLQLAPAGTDITLTENLATGTFTNVTGGSTLAATPINAIKLTGTMNVPGISNASAFYKVWSGPYVIQSNDALAYFVWVDTSSPEVKATVDLVCSDGTRLQDQDLIGGFDYADENDITPAPYSDLAGYADGKWYYRFFSIKGFAGKTLTYASVALGGQKAGNYTAYFRGIRVYNGSTNATQVNIFGTSLAISPQQIQSVAYTNVAINVVPTYNLQNYNDKDITPDIVAASVTYGDAVHERISSAYTIATAVLLKNSVISWDVTEPDNTKFAVRCALDNGTPVECTNGAAIPNLLPGMNLTGRSLTIYQDFYYLDAIATPELTPVLNALNATILSAPAATKTDASYKTLFSPGESGTSFSSTTTNSTILNLIGATRNWDLSIGTARYITGASSYLQDQSVYLGTAGDTIDQRVFQFGNPSAGNESKSRFDFAGQHQNFTAEIDVQPQSDISLGLVYRSTNFSSNNGSYAYAVMLSVSGIVLKKGTNTTGGGSATSLQSVSFTLQDKSWHRLKVVVNGSSHSIYLDDVLQFTKTDSSFGATGYIGVIGVSPSQAYPAFNFDNFGVADVLSGTWTSPNISLNSVASYGNSYISWRDRSDSPASNDTIKVEYTINGGSTWIVCTNGAALPGLTAGQSLTSVNLKLRVTISSTTAQSMPGIDNLYVLITGAYSATGTRVAPGLDLTPVGRAGSTLVAWNATLPAGATLKVEVGPNTSTWTDVTASNGGEIPFIDSQPAPFIDTFDADSSTDYTSTSRSGGSVAAYTWNTAGRRLDVSGGSQSLLTFNPDTTFLDGEITFDSDQADQTGFFLRYQDSNNYYDVAIYDNASSLVQNTMQIYRVSGGTRTLLTAAPVDYKRGIIKRIKGTIEGSTITLYFDGALAVTYSDSSPLTVAGECGIRAGLSTTAGTSHVNQFIVQNYGEDCSGQSVYSKLTLTSTDPTVSPIVPDLSVSAHNPDIQNGVLIPATDYSGKKQISECIADLASQSNYWWTVRTERIAGDLTKKLIFKSRTGEPSAWILSSLSGDLLVNGLTVTNQSDLYRNRQYVRGAIDTSTFIEKQVADGTATSWTLGYKVASAPSITINGDAATVGVKGIDTGRDCYYEVGSNTITLDSSKALAKGQLIVFIYLGQFEVTVMREDAAEQAAFALIEKGSGIVENVIDVTGQNMSRAAAEQLAQSNLDRYKVRGRTIAFQTRKHGLKPGQLQTVFISQHGIADGLYLINRIKTTLRSITIDGVSRQDSLYSVEASEGANLGSWAKLFVKK